MRPKRLISLLVAVCMMITMLPLSAVTAFAEDTSPSTGTASSGGYKYDYEVDANGNATITKFLGPDDSVNPVDSASTVSYSIDIPSELNHHPVTGLGENSFAFERYDGYEGNPLCKNIHSVTIPQGITSIGDHAFYYCSALTKVTIPQGITSIGDSAFYGCSALTEVTIPQSVTSIGYHAFFLCTGLHSLTINDAATSIGKEAFMHCSLTSLSLGEYIKTIGDSAFQQCGSVTEVTIPQSVTSIGERAFKFCYGLTNVTIPEKVETIERDTFNSCFSLKSITLPAELKSFQDKLENCPADCVIYYKNYKAAARDRFGENAVGDNAVLAGHKLLYLCKVTFDANGGDPTDFPEMSVYRTKKINATDLDAINAPKRAGYKFTGWYTDTDGKQLFNADETAITDDITLYAGWKSDPNALGCHPLTVTGGTVTVKYNGSDVTSTLNSSTDATTGKKTYDVPDGAEVTVTLDKTLIPEGMVFDIWSTGKFSLPLGQDYKAETITFPMSSGVDIAAQYRDASIEDDEPDIVGPIVIGTTVVVGGAVLGYQAYSLGAEFAGKLMALPYFPSNRSALAMMLWEDAGKPMPESELLYPDVGQEERDMDLQHAARWAMENELIPDLNDEGTAPEEMKFYPDNAVSKIDVLNAWQKAQELKQNA